MLPVPSDPSRMRDAFAERPMRPDTPERAAGGERAARSERTERGTRGGAVERRTRAERGARSEAPGRAESAEATDAAARTDEANDARAARRREAPDFSTLLALMAAPAAAAPELAATDGQSTLDRLLDDAAGAPSSESATDALRYGLLAAGGTGAAGDGSAALSTRTDAAARGRAGLAGLARAAQRAQAVEVLSALAERRGASLDDLLAVGDARGADLRSALDALLAQAGTPEGLAIADGRLAGSMTDDGVLASAAVQAALVAARAASAADVGTPVRDPSALLPEFRSRLDRVVARMKAEYGHDVTLVETVRSAERQDHLFEQGRTRPGPVVTWTRDSAHELGAAADVLIDGRWDNANGYARLQRIATEEGLRTLGVRDPGHLELPLDASARAALARALQDTADATRAAQAQRLAAPASNTQAGAAAMTGASGVARVAAVAGVARVATVAEPGAVRSDGLGGSVTGSVAGAAMASATSGAGATAGRDGDARRDGTGRGDGGRGRADVDGIGGPGAARDREEMAQAGIPAFGARPVAAHSATGAGGTAPAAGAEAAQRVADLQALRDGAPAGAVSQLTMDIDTADGGSERITVGLRGSAVGAHIATDPATAERLRLRTAELREALGRHGLEAEQVRISVNARAGEAESARAVATERDGLRLAGLAGSSAGDGLAQQGQPQRERAALAREWEKQDDARRAREERQQPGRDGGRNHHQEETR
jgi:hypothetical protein